MRFPLGAPTSAVPKRHRGAPDKTAERLTSRLASLFQTCRQRKVILTKALDEEPNPPGVNVGEAALGVRELAPRQRAEASEPGATLSARGWRELARHLGFVRVGVAAVDAEALALEAQAKAATRRWVDTGLHGGLGYMTAPRSSPSELLPGVRSVIVALAPTDNVNSK